MATVKHRIRENDPVELLEPTERWQAGRMGTVVAEQGDLKLVEIADDSGEALDFISVPELRLRLVPEQDGRERRTG